MKHWWQKTWWYVEAPFPWIPVLVAIVVLAAVAALVTRLLWP